MVDNLGEDDTISEGTNQHGGVALFQVGVEDSLGGTDQSLLSLWIDSYSVDTILEVNLREVR